LLTFLGGAIFVWVTFALIFTWIAAAFYPFIERIIKSLPVRRRLSWRLTYVCLPFLLAWCVLILFTQPELIKVIVDGHCHEQVCAPHWLKIDSETLESQAFIISSIAFFISVFAFIIRQFVVSKRYLTLLNQLSSEANVKNKMTAVRVIETPAALAWCAGLFNPKVFLSKALLDKLTADELTVLLKHEYTHASRHDNLRKWILHWASGCWPKPIKVKLKQRYLYDTELLSDLSAISHSGQTEQLASAIDKSLFLASCHCQNATEKNKSSGVRIADINAERAQARVNYKPAQWVLGICMFIINIILILLSLHFGHPFLEWVSG